MRLRARRQPSQFWPILTRFVNYYSPFWDPKAISIVIEPQGVLTCRSSTVTVLADSGPFRGLLLTVLGSQKRFPWLLNPKVRLRVGHQQSQFGPILARFMDYYLLILGPKAISMVVEPHVVLTCWSSTLAV